MSAPNAATSDASKEAADCRDALAAIIRAVANGELTPGEAATLAKLIADFAGIDQATETERKMRERKARGPLGFGPGL